MDRRQQKTRKAIFDAFRTLLESKRFDKITVQDIIDEANVGRSTFYAHFETKELLVSAMCSEIFYHIFENDPCQWTGSDNALEGKLAHILWHIKDSKKDICGLILSDSSELFMKYFKEHLRDIFEMHIADFKTDVPKDFLLNHLVSGFAETVRWWMKHGMKTSPETTAEYFLKLCKCSGGEQ